MTIKVASEQEIIGEATRLLLGGLAPSRLARLWSAWHLGDGNYQTIRDELFAEETLDSLATQIRSFEAERAGDI